MDFKPTDVASAFAGVAAYNMLTSPGSSGKKPTQRPRYVPPVETPEQAAERKKHTLANEEIQKIAIQNMKNEIIDSYNSKLDNNDKIDFILEMELALSAPPEDGTQQKQQIAMHSALGDITPTLTQEQRTLLDNKKIHDKTYKEYSDPLNNLILSDGWVWQRFTQLWTSDNKPKFNTETERVNYFISKLKGIVSEMMPVKEFNNAIFDEVLSDITKKNPNYYAQVHSLLKPVSTTFNSVFGSRPQVAASAAAGPRGGTKRKRGKNRKSRRKRITIRKRKSFMNKVK
jgi:hypothetical protein